MILNKKVYDVLARISRYALPAIGGLYYALADIWGLPYGAQVLASCTALTVAINILLGIDSVKYNQDLLSKSEKDHLSC